MPCPSNGLPARPKHSPAHALGRAEPVTYSAGRARAEPNYADQPIYHGPNLQDYHDARTEYTVQGRVKAAVWRAQGLEASRKDWERVRVATLLRLEMGAVSLGRPREKVFGVLYSNESRERR
jgi:hypothetical protein